MNLAPWDELDVLRERIESFNQTEGKTRKEMIGLCEDLILDLLILSYLYGTDDADVMLGTNLAADDKKMAQTINRKIAGKTYIERISEYVDENGVADVGRIMRVADAEMTRDYNQAIMDTAKASGVSGVMKRWNTMRDNRVRETHDALEGVEVELDEAFFTFDGDSAMAPGGFETPENNVGCRCYLTLTVA